MILTYDNQPNNDEAWRFGQIVRIVSEDKNCGDYIDRGLILLRELQAKGYGIVRLPRESEGKQS